MTYNVLNGTLSLYTTTTWCLKTETFLLATASVRQMCIPQMPNATKMVAYCVPRTTDIY